MVMKYISKRLERLEQKAKPEHTEIIERIKSGAFYDELTEIEKDAYCDYKEVEREVFEEVNLCVLESLHVKLEMKNKPPTKKQFIETVKEVEKMIIGE